MAPPKSKLSHMTQPHTIQDIPTPALILDVTTMERNIKRTQSVRAERVEARRGWP
jgi:D-serine deaminase-like pyridoxal phosphate-dependent protein